MLALPYFLEALPIDNELGTSQRRFMDRIIAKAHYERHIETIVMLKRRTDRSCMLEYFNPVGLPTLRLDESSDMPIKKLFNVEVLALLCMSDSDDTVLLDALAQDLYWMRDARIMVWLCGGTSALRDVGHIIGKLSTQYSFINLLVLHSLTHMNGIVVPYRLHPFPNATLRRIPDVWQAPIFPTNYHNFYGKHAVILPDMHPPYSMLSIDRRTGKESLYGYFDQLIAEFARRRNIQLKWHRPLDELKGIEIEEVYRLTLGDQLDLPIRSFVQIATRHSGRMEFSCANQISTIFIVVPCAQVMSIGDVFSGLKTYSIIVLTAYFMFAILETIIVAASNRLHRQKHSFSYSSVIINLRAFSGVLGLPIHLSRRRTTMSLKQIVLIMSLFSIIFSCVFNANLSTLLIKQPQHQQIRSMDELQASGLRIVAERGLRKFAQMDLNENSSIRGLHNLVILPYLEAEYLLHTFNTSNAYFVYSKQWQSLNEYQRTYKMNALCQSPGLSIMQLHVSGVLKRNSIFKAAFNEFLHLTRSVGLSQNWGRQTARKIMENIQQKRSNVPLLKSQERKSLCMKDFKWLWQMIGICYGVAGIFLICEIAVDFCIRKRMCNKGLPF
ncbi:hypothetical protein KR222_007774 [Zaprionus bogoriensis]|nr:hypothetical protein KR222_007774 [Zaprionus bogoriensis]